MKLIERADLNVEKWDALASSESVASFFSQSWYLDAVAENWCVLVDDNYTKGLALPYSKRMGVQILYVPIFGRYAHVFGNLEAADLAVVKKRFSVREFAATSAIFENASERHHQVIADFEKRKLSSQAKRSLKKANNSGIEVTGNGSYANIFQAIEQELEGKFSGVDAERLKRLKELFEAAKENNSIKVFEVSDGKEIGGIVCLQSETQVLYLKGACPENLKRNGGMYLALNAAIEFAEQNKVTFDFGGSNIEGVRRFNTNLGGVDTSYYFHEANEAPFWFQWARKIKNRGKR
jgi:hypothetical protein